LQVRTGRSQLALDELKIAAEGAPQEARYGYVYAIALDSAGRRREAIKILKSVLSRQPNDRNTLWALAAWQVDGGNRREAAENARRLAALEPDNPDVRALLERSK
jgi:Flp pilus assembly protein TadD